jgi:ribonuclease HI
MAKKDKELEPQSATHGVFYTDGGCKLGVGGYGVHGYTFALAPAKQGTGCKSAIPTAKGYVMDKTGIPDITLFNYVDAVGSLLPESTNNIAELKALQKTFDILNELNLSESTLLLDSKYVLEGITEHAPKWEANNWCRADGQGIANLEIWQNLVMSKEALENKGHIFNFSWIKGHSGNLGNETADEWASKGIAAGKNDIKVDELIISPAKGYWNGKPEINRLFSHKNWYFNSKLAAGSDTDGAYFTYYLGDPREDDELLGKKLVDATFSVLHMNAEEPILERIRKAHAETDILQYGTPVLGHLDAIFRGDVYEDVARFDDHFLRRDFHNGRLTAIGGEDPMGRVLTRELRPPRLAFAAMDNLQWLESVLINHEKGNEGTHQVSTEITAILYETAQVGKKDVFKLKSTITNTEKFIPVLVKYDRGDGVVSETTIRLTLGHDLPDRNTLAAIADQDPKVYVATWPESPTAIRYATIVEAASGRGVWAAVYSNLHLVQPSTGGESSS